VQTSNIHLGWHVLPVADANGSRRDDRCGEARCRTDPVSGLCGPDNLPFSNRRGEGFDNKIVQLLAAAEGKPLVYAWWPERRGFIRNTLNRWECDVVVGVPTGYELTATTRLDYCSTYVDVQRAGEPAQAGSERRPAQRVGVMVQTPPLDLCCATMSIRTSICPLMQTGRQTRAELWTTSRPAESMRPSSGDRWPATLPPASRQS
jgi:hypothetical protein